MFSVCFSSVFSFSCFFFSFLLLRTSSHFATFLAWDLAPSCNPRFSRVVSSHIRSRLLPPSFVPFLRRSRNRNSLNEELDTPPCSYSLLPSFVFPALTPLHAFSALLIVLFVLLCCMRVSSQCII